MEAFCPDHDGDLPLHIAVAKEDEQEVRRILYEMQMQRIQVDVINNLRQTPLHLAVLTNNVTIVRLLLEHGASPARPDRHGNTAIHLASKNGATNSLIHLIDFLHDHKNINVHNFDGFAPLHLAVFQQDIDAIRTLVCRNADVDVTDGKSGRTPLFHSIENGFQSTVELLLSFGASVNLANYAGVTPLIAATDRGNRTVTSMLISRGAMVSARDESTTVHEF